MLTCSTFSATVIITVTKLHIRQHKNFVDALHRGTNMFSTWVSKFLLRKMLLSFFPCASCCTGTLRMELNAVEYWPNSNWNHHPSDQEVPDTLKGSITNHLLLFSTFHPSTQNILRFFTQLWSVWAYKGVSVVFYARVYVCILANILCVCWEGVQVCVCVPVYVCMRVCAQGRQLG